MKTYEEMAQSVLTRIEEYETEKQIKRQKIRKAAFLSIPVCAAVVAAAGVFQSGFFGNNNNIPVAEPEKSVVSSVSEKENKTVSSNDSKEENRSVSSKADKKNKLNSSQKKGISSRDVTTESAIANSDPDYESSNDIESISEEDVSSSAAVGTQIHESNKDTERTSSQTLSTAKDEETPDPSLYSEHSFEYVEDALGIMYVDDVMYIQFDVYDDGFTLDENIGAASNFNGYYKNIKDVTGEVYTVKESPDVLIVKLSNGGTVALAKAGQLIVNGTPYCSTMLDTNVYLADKFIGHVSDFETVNVPYLNHEIELSPDDEVYTVADKDEGTLCIKQENGNAVIFVSIW